jgi:hypothetical protein
MTAKLSILKHFRAYGIWFSLLSPCFPYTCQFSRRIVFFPASLLFRTLRNLHPLNYEAKGSHIDSQSKEANTAYVAGVAQPFAYHVGSQYILFSAASS